ncbi:MAG: cation:proton antiporter [Merdibacter sp.]
MAFVPATFEILAYVLFALPSCISLTDAAVMGAVMGAVSPAVVVPRMVALMEEHRGTAKGIPQMILAGASCDDIYVIVLFTTFVAMAQGGSHASDLLQVQSPSVSAPCSASLPGSCSPACSTSPFIMDTIRNSNKIILILGTSFVAGSGDLAERHPFPVRLLAVVAMACTLQRSAPSTVTARLSEKLGKLWIAERSCCLSWSVPPSTSTR